MNGECSSCKHWKRHNGIPPWGDCALLSDPMRQEDPYLTDIDVEFKLSSENIPGYKVTIETHADFGCKLWEETS